MNSPDEQFDSDDAAILAAVRDLYRTTDPVPDDLTTEIRFALSVQALHAEVAELQRSGFEVTGGDHGLVAAYREDDYTRTESLTFGCDSLNAMITITRLDPETVRIDGWLTVPSSTVELRVQPRSAGSAAAQLISTVEADEDGRFTMPRIEKGLAQLVFRHAGTRPVITPYVEL